MRREVVPGETFLSTAERPRDGSHDRGRVANRRRADGRDPFDKLKSEIGDNPERQLGLAHAAWTGQEE